jgi:predicted RNase H-like HicB family nuclease
MTDFAVIYEQAHDGGWHARAADLPVYTVGDTREEAEQGIREAIALYLQALIDDGEMPPTPRSVAGTVTVA